MANKTRGVQLNGTQMKIARQPTDVAGVGITALTNASPAVATAENTLKNGDVIYLTSEANPELNRMYTVSNVSGNTFKIVGLDTINKGEITDAKFQKLETIGLCNVKSMKINYGSVNKEDVTVNCDAQKYEVGIWEPGEIDLEVLYEPDSEFGGYVHSLLTGQQDTMFQFTDGTRVKSVICSVDEWNIDASVNQKTTGSVKLKNKTDFFDVQIGA